MAKKKIKLPRKRKKAYIKDRGSNNYRGMRIFLKMEGKTKFPNHVAPIIDSNGMPDFITVTYW